MIVSKTSTVRFTRHGGRIIEKNISVSPMRIANAQRHCARSPREYSETEVADPMFDQRSRTISVYFF